MRMPNLTQALRVRKVLYHLRGLPLPVPMTVPEFGMVLVGSLVAFVMLTAHLVASPVELLILGGVVAILVYALRQEAVDGKTPGQWLVTAVRWLSSPPALVGERPDLERDLPVRVDGFVVPGTHDDLRSWTPSPALLPVAEATEAPVPAEDGHPLLGSGGWLPIEQLPTPVAAPAGGDREGGPPGGVH